VSGHVSFPRRSAVTRRFTLGRPRRFAVARDGSRVAFLRSPAGDDPAMQLWVFEVAARGERLVADPVALAAGADADLPAAERARRERAREAAGGIVAYAADPELRVASFALGGRVFVADLIEGGARALPATDGAFDPRIDPTGARVAYVADRSLRVVTLDGADRVVAEEDDPNISWGSAEFVAAEEMDRSRGFWWAPDGARLIAARVDTSPVGRWHLADPANPATPARELAYPAAGTANADVSLAIFDVGATQGRRVDVQWDRGAFPYLVRVVWTEGSPPTLLVQSRDQRTQAVLVVEPKTGATEVLEDLRDDQWVEIVPGVPAWTADGRLVVATEDRPSDTRRVFVAGDPVTPVGLQVRAVAYAGQDVVFTASTEPTETQVWRLRAGGALEQITAEPGVHGAAAGGDVVVVSSLSMDDRDGETVVLASGDRVGTIRSFAETPSVRPTISFLRAGARELRTALLLPSGGADGPLPVLLDPYGGPHAQRVVRARDAFLQSQWLADQGFAVVVADGRGTPGRGLAWERSVHLDLATSPLEDQVDALQAVAEANPGVLDLSRVAIRGWSFGGYLAALAVLRRPDVFHAAVAGAPVSDWRLYDTHYTERYLGLPEEHPEAYERSSRLADDNVVAAHSLRLSGALLEAGRPHAFLPLAGVTHMTPQEVVAENLLLLQVAFLRQALGLEGRVQQEAGSGMLSP
jgi:dipeptidyl-peptidase 4